MPWTTGSQLFSDHVPLQHFDRLACTPKISYDKKAEQNNKNPLNFYWNFYILEYLEIINIYIHFIFYC